MSVSSQIRSRIALFFALQVALPFPLSCERKTVQVPWPIQPWLFLLSFCKEKHLGLTEKRADCNRIFDGWPSWSPSILDSFKDERYLCVFSRWPGAHNCRSSIISACVRCLRVLQLHTGSCRRASCSEYAEERAIDRSWALLALKIMASASNGSPPFDNSHGTDCVQSCLPHPIFPVFQLAMVFKSSGYESPLRVSCVHHHSLAVTTARQYW